MNLDQFLLLYPLRAQNIMWFLGAGASANANVPTAWDLTWRFKQRLYAATERIPLKSIDDLSNPRICERIQRHFDDAGGFPKNGSSEEYAFYFERVYPSEQDRRTFLEAMLSGATPSFGHHVLGALMQMGLLRLVWTTNFDRLIEDAAVECLGGTGKLVSVALENAGNALAAINAGRWPILLKPHGDFQSTRLKNTSAELREQDAQLRRALIKSCDRFGLAVVGYSGRDESIMSSLTEALHVEESFPQGIFWFHRPSSPILGAVDSFIDSARRLGREAVIVEVPTFDELMGDIYRQLPNVPAQIRERIEPKREKVSNVPIPGPGTKGPLIRTNAFPVLSSPMLCRRVTCNVQGAKDVRSRVEAAGNKIVAARRKIGVLAYGSDVDVRSTFQGSEITEFDIHSIEGNRLRYESPEFSLLYAALTRALKRGKPLVASRRHGNHLLVVDIAKTTDAIFSNLSIATAEHGQQVGQIAGTVPRASAVTWAEAVSVQLEFRLSKLWVLIDPAIYLHKGPELEIPQEAKDFVRERTARRYNRQYFNLLNAWRDLLFGINPESTVRAFDIADGVDAVFTVSTVTGFTYRN